MTDEERQRWDLELEALKAQTSLQLKQSSTEVWKVVIGAFAAGGIVGGAIVGLLSAN